MISTGELKKGATIEHDGKLYSILDYNHIKMGRGSAQVRIKLRDVRSGSITEQTFQAGTKWPRARVERREMQYLYSDDQFYYFMNTESYEQIELSADDLGDMAGYLLPETVINVQFYESSPIGIDIPAVVELTVVETEPEVKGATVSNVGKPAKLNTGITIQVPAFIKEGDRIRVDTTEGRYMERAK